MAITLNSQEQVFQLGLASLSVPSFHAIVWYSMNLLNGCILNLFFSPFPGSNCQRIG